MIVLLHGAPAFGAVESYVIDLAAGYAERGVPVAVVYPDVPELAPFAQIAPGVLGIPVPPDLVQAGAFGATVRGLRRVLRTLRPSLVHVTDVWPAGLVAARAAGIRRLVVTHHTPELQPADNLRGALLRRIGWAMVPEVIYTSATDRTTDGGRRRAHVVPLGIDLDRFARPTRLIDGVAPVIGTVGRLAPQKSQRTLLEAAPLVLAEVPEAHFVVAGDGELRGELAELAERLGLESRVTFTGHRNDVEAVLATFDVFVLSSLFEGLCLAVVEAQVAGLPVVATPVGGVRETVIPGETGVLVPPRDPEALASGILSLLHDPASAARYAREGQARARARFGIPAMVEATLAVYEAA